VGGKSQLFDRIYEKIPSNINTYFELFLGGGSLLIGLLKKLEKDQIKIQRLICNDLNNELINSYKCIRYNTNKLCIWLEFITNQFNKQQVIEYKKRHKFNITIDSSLITDGPSIKKLIETQFSQESKQHFYYSVRELYNILINSYTTDKHFYDATRFIRATLFIFLNKTCFRGLHRISNGRFNVPYGNYVNPTIYSKEHLMFLGQLFVKYNVIFTSLHYSELLKYITDSRDFVYIDPPYYPINRSSFISYNKDDFDSKEHSTLIQVCDYIHSKKCKFIHSNSDVEYNHANYKHFRIEKLNCKRRINSKNPKSTVDELLISN